MDHNQIITHLRTVLSQGEPVASGTFTPCTQFENVRNTIGQPTIFRLILESNHRDYATTCMHGPYKCVQIMERQTSIALVYFNATENFFTNSSGI